MNTQNVSQIIEQLSSAKGEEKRQLLLELCEFRCKEADEYFTNNCKRPMLHYLCFSRCDAASDFTAELLEKALNKLIITGNQCSAEMSEEMFAALCLTAFKQSEKMVEVLRKAGTHYGRLRLMELDMRALINSQSLPPYIRKTANKAFSYCCETNLFRLLNDLLICTAARSGGEFNVAIKELHREFPQAYGCAAFFVYFTEDNSAAFERFGDASHLIEILNTMTGTYFSPETGDYRQSVPTWFYGLKQQIFDKRLALGKPLDIRWVELLTSFEDKQLGRFLGSDNPWTIHRHFDAILLNITDPKRADISGIITRYCANSAAKWGGMEALEGLRRLGFDDYPGLVKTLCENICAGISRYYAFYNIFACIDLPRAEKLSLLQEAEEFLREKEHSELLRNQREEFFREVELFRLNKKGFFKNKVTL